MIGPIRHLSFPYPAWEGGPDPARVLDSFIYGAAPFAYAYTPVPRLSLYWRLTDAAIQAEFWVNLNRSLRDSHYRMLMTASRPPMLG